MTYTPKVSSLAEVQTDATWHDGKPIFEKIVAFASGPNNADLLVAHGVPAIDTMIELRATMKAPTGGQGSIRELPFVGAPLAPPIEDTAIQLRLLDGNIRLMAKANYSASSGHIFMTYTKP